MKKSLLILSLLLLPSMLWGQHVLDRNNRRISMGTGAGNTGFGNDDTEENRSFQRNSSDKDKQQKEQIPVGLRTWTVNGFNETDSIVPDTMGYQFQNFNFTEGITGRYNTLGNMGSPRMSRIFADRPAFDYFIFVQPYDFFIQPFSAFHFTNTLSPFTNITYHETTSSDDGEDRITAKFAVNANKEMGFGFKLDYLYGRGYYDHQATSQFGATLYGSIFKEKYKAHFRIFSNYLKTSENGGIQDDEYISNPQNFPSKFSTKDIPTNLTKAWNKLYHTGAELTHSYSIGFYRVEKTADSLLAVTDSIRSALLHKLSSRRDSIASDSASRPTDSLNTRKTIPVEQKADTVQIVEERTFVPVTKLIHSLSAYTNQKKFIANRYYDTFFTDDYMTGDSALDKVSHQQVSNLLAVELCEGFNKWAPAGIRLFAKHDFNHYSLPLTPTSFNRFNENRITLGGMLFKRSTPLLQYTLNAQTSSDGDSWGEFLLYAQGRLQLPLWHDTITLRVKASAENARPTFFYRHFQSKYLWWDNDNLDKQFTSRISAQLQIPQTKTQLTLDIQNIKKYTYFANTTTPVTDGTNTWNTMSTAVRQASDNIQIVGLTLNQAFRLGILNWEGEATWQTTSSKEVLPLPTFSAYTNLYLLFRIAKVLNVQFGGDLRYFTAYYAPTYNPALGMYSNQDASDAVKIGDYPIINVYANFHLKHTRFYIMYSHLNYSRDGGKSFLAPHYPINPGILKLGLSWNFFN